MYVNTNQTLETSSEVGWISNSKVILTINNEFCLLNLFHKNWIKLEKSNIEYCKQHVNMGTFVSILRVIPGKEKSKIKKENLI